MKKIVFFNTAYGSQNMGDYIINEAVEREMREITEGNFVTQYGTHLPLTRFWQNVRKNSITRYCRNADLKFICGTNILHKNLNRLTPTFNVNLYETKNYRNSILIGCGVSGTESKFDWRTKLIYKRILSKDYIHSVRDEEAKKYLESMGFAAINTGCPTIWGLDAEFCKQIPTKKADKVVFTLTDYKKGRVNDQKLIDVLVKCYKEVYFWVQGGGDYEYLKSMSNTENVKMLYSLREYKELLEAGKIDYVGTRLHAGILAMQKRVRSIILIVNNRARDMKASYNLPTIEREAVDQLEEMIKSDFRTDVRIDKEKIESWKAQFKNGQ